MFSRDSWSVQCCFKAGELHITLLTFTLQPRPTSLMSHFFWKPVKIIYYGTLAYTKYSMNKPLTLSAVIVKQSSCGIYFFQFMEIFFLLLRNRRPHWNQRSFTEDIHPMSYFRLLFSCSINSKFDYSRKSGNPDTTSLTSFDIKI